MPGMTNQMLLGHEASQLSKLLDKLIDTISGSQTRLEEAYTKMQVESRHKGRRRAFYEYVLKVREEFHKNNIIIQNELPDLSMFAMHYNINVEVIEDLHKQTRELTMRLNKKPNLIDPDALEDKIGRWKNAIEQYTSLVSGFKTGTIFQSAINVTSKLNTMNILGAPDQLSDDLEM